MSFAKDISKYSIGKQKLNEMVTSRRHRSTLYLPKLIYGNFIILYNILFVLQIIHY